MDRLRVEIDRSSPIPLYFQAATGIEAAIVSGELPVGERLENEIDLAEQLGLSRPTMRRAIQELVDKGLLVRKRGVGTQVVQQPVHRTVELTSLYDDLRRLGRSPQTRVLAVATVPAPDKVATQLGLAVGTEIVRIERLRLSDGDPLALMTNYLPIEVGINEDSPLAEDGLYELMRRKGVRIRVAQQQIGARAATAEEAELLGESVGAPLLTMQRTAFDDTGRAVEFGSHVYRPELYSFDIRLVDR